MENDNLKQDVEAKDGQDGKESTASVINLDSARAKIIARKKRLEQEEKRQAAEFEAARRSVAGSERRYKFARGLQIFVMVIALVYLMHTCGFLKFPG